MFLAKEVKNKYKIFSRKKCEEYCTKKHNKTSLIISIKSNCDDNMPQVFISDQNKVLAILSLSFDDVEKEDAIDDREICMSFEDGDKVANFIAQWYDKVEDIIVHCDGGVSRSAGVAAAIMRVKEGDDWPIFDSSVKHPNMTCYLRTLKGFHYI